jgi:hypothetical protein
MFARFTLAVLVAVGFSLHAGAADLAAIKRVIQKEPAYQGKPKYCLLVFGKKADTHVWMVRDGKNFYVDANGNGDLTEPGEKVVAGGSPTFSFARIVERDGTRHQGLSVYCHNDGTLTMTLGQGGARTQYVGVDLMDRPAWGDTPEKAPIIHFNGPMSFERYGPMVKIPRGGGGRRALSLRLMLGTPGVGKGTFASYDEICGENLGPIRADIVYSHATRIGEMFEQRIELLHDG